MIVYYLHLDRDGGLDMWKPANATSRLLTSAFDPFCTVINPRIMSISRSFGKYLENIWKISRDIQLMPGLYPAQWQKRDSASGFAATKYYSTNFAPNKKWLYHQHLVLERSKLKRECPQHDYQPLFVQALRGHGKTQV